MTDTATGYLESVRRTLDTLIDRGADRYGRVHAPIWMAILDVETLDSPRHPPPLDEATRVQRRGRRAPGGGNLFLDGAMLRAADRLSALTGEARYRAAAERYVGYYLRHFVDPQTGLIEWGPHNFYDAFADAIEYLEGHHHEIHAWLPPWPLLHRAAPAAVEREIAQIWEWHVDHTTARFGRHPDRGAGCSFAMTGGEFVAAFAFLYRATGRPEPLEWALRVARTHWHARDRDTDLIPNQAEMEEEAFKGRFDCRTTDTSISGLWCGRLLVAAQLTGRAELREMAVAVLRACLTYQWQGTAHPWGQLRLDGTPVPDPRATEGYDQWAPRGALDLWPAYLLGYEYPQETALAYVLAHRLTGDPAMLDGARRWAAVFAADRDRLRERGGTYAQHYGMIVAFFVELHREGGDRAHLDTARAFADQALDLLDTGRIFRGHPAKQYYEAADGVGFLCYGLLQLVEELRGIETDRRDPFALNL